jgi:hypothetical protein
MKLRDTRHSGKQLQEAVTKHDETKRKLRALKKRFKNQAPAVTAVTALSEAERVLSASRGLMSRTLEVLRSERCRGAIDSKLLDATVTKLEALRSEQFRGMLGNSGALVPKRSK